MKKDSLQTIADIEKTIEMAISKFSEGEIDVDEAAQEIFNILLAAPYYHEYDNINLEEGAILDKFESDCMNAPNFAEGLRIAFDNLPDNFLK